MKGFIAGVLGTLLAGILLFLAQDWYNSNKAANQKSVSVDISDDLISANKEQLLAAAKSENVNDFRLASISIKNVGTKSVLGAKIHFGSSIGNDVNVVGFGIVPDAQSDAETVQLKPVKTGFDVDVKALSPGKRHTVWVLYACCEIFSASPLTDDLQLTQSVSEFKDLDDDRDDFWWWFSLGIGGIVAFVLGAVLDSTINSSMLKSRGHDLAALLKEPVISPAPKSP